MSETGERDLDFDELYRQYSPTVYRLALRLCNHSSDAEDVFQEVFLRVYRFLDSHRGGSIPGWLRRITTNVFLSKQRLASSREVPDESAGEAVPSLVDDPAGQLEAALLGPELDSALQSLAPEIRATIVLRCLEDLSYQEISELLEVPIGTVRSRLARGRASLLSKLCQKGVSNVCL